jgi:hypothetical protein
MADDDAFEGAFDDWNQEIRPGTVISDLIGRLRYRQGNDPRDWSGAGGSKYLPMDWHMQCGTQKWTGPAATSGGFEITYPTPFGENPVIVGVPINTTPLYKDVRIQMTHQSAAVCEVYWWSADNLTRVDVSWLALGPISL